MAKKHLTIDDEPIVKAMPPMGSDDGDDMDEDMDEDDVGDEDMDDEDMDEDDAEKSDMTEMDLVKALDEMDNIAAASANGVNPRERALAAKLAGGSPLTKSERVELASFGDFDDEMAKSHKEQFMETPQIAQGFEVSDFLDAAFSKVAEALDANRAEMSKSFAETGEFNRALAKSLNALGAVVIAQDRKIRQLEKSLAGDVAPMRVEAAPAKGATRTSVGQRVNDSGAIRKSQSQPQGMQLTKGMILDTLDEQIAKSEGQRGVVDGVDLVLEASRYETTQLLSPDAMRLVCKVRGLDPTSLGLNG